MREYRGYYEITPNETPRLGLALTAQVTGLTHNRTHWHDCVEIICRLRGHVTVEVEQVPYRLGPGDVLVIDSHLAHRFVDSEADGLQAQLVISNELIYRDSAQLIRLSTVGEGALHKDDPEISALRSHCGRLAELCAPLSRDSVYLTPTVRSYLEQEGVPLPLAPDALLSSQVWYEARIELYSLLSLLLRHTVPTGRDQRRVPPEFIRCVGFVQENFHRRITADDVGEACGYSRRTVFRLFQNYMGTPFKEYLSFVRVDAACKLLQTTPMTTAAVASCVGLSESQFYRVFQQITGMTPGEWQQAAPGQGQLQLSYAPEDRSVLSRGTLGFELMQKPDWDWITGRKGWEF